MSYTQLHNKFNFVSVGYWKRRTPPCSAFPEAPFRGRKTSVCATKRTRPNLTLRKRFPSAHGGDGRGGSLSLYFFRGGNRNAIKAPPQRRRVSPPKRSEEGKKQGRGEPKGKTPPETPKEKGGLPFISTLFFWGFGGYNIKPFGGWTCPFAAGDPCEAAAAACAQHAAVSRSQYRETQSL